MITNHQYELSLDLAYKRALPKGYVPTPSQVSTEAATRFDGVPNGSPTLRVIHLLRKERFPRKEFNSFLSNVWFDLQVAYSEFVDLFKHDLDSLVIRNNEVNSLTSELGTYQKIAEDLQKAITSITAYTTVTGDSFNDTNFVDRTNTNAEVDIDAGVVTLKRSSAGTSRVSLQHLWKSYVPNMQVSEVPPTSVLRNAPVPGHGFSNAMMDSNSSWLQSILLDKYSGPLTADIDIPVVEANSQAVRISKVELRPVGVADTDIQVFVSADGDTFSQFGESIQTNSRSLVFHGPGSDVKVLRIRMRKMSYDSQQGNLFEYVLGAEHIRLFRIAYSQTSTMYSKDYEIPGDIRTIQLDTSETAPDGTDIHYLVKVSGETESGWAEITPLNKSGNAPKQISISSSRVVDEDLPLNSSDAIQKTANGMAFYKVAEYPTAKVIDPRSAKLYRGVNAWRMRMDKNIVRKTARDVFINFHFQSPDGRQNLYAFRSDDATVVSTGEILSDQTRPAASLRTPYRIEYNGASMTTIPTERGDHFDQEPNYAIASILRSVSGNPVGFTTIQSDLPNSDARMKYQPNAQDSYLTTAQLRVNGSEVAAAAKNEIVNQSFVQEEDVGGVKVFSYTDATSPEMIRVFRPSTGTGADIGKEGFILVGEFTVIKNGYITYPGVISYFAEYNGNQYMKVEQGAIGLQDSTLGIIENWGEFANLVNLRTTAVYILYASLATDPVSPQQGSSSDGYLLVPSVSHFEEDPTMFQGLILPTSVFIKTVDGSVEGHYDVTAVTKARVLKTYSKDHTEYVTVDALLINTGRGSSIPPANSFDIQSWYLSYSDITQNVSGIENDTIRFKSGFQFTDRDKVVVTYRAKFGDKLKAIGETIVVTSEPGTRGVKYTLDQDYRVDPGTGTIMMVQNGAINRGNSGRAYVTMDYNEEMSDLFSFTTWFHSSRKNAVDLAISKFGGYLSESEAPRTKLVHDISLDRSLGEEISISGPDGAMDLDKGAKFKVKEGWYYVSVSAKDMYRARDLLSALDEANAPVFAVGGNFDVMRAYKDPLKFLHPDSFYDSNRLGSHKFFTIDPSYGIIISFNPGDNALLSNKLYDVYKGELLSGIFEGNLIQRPQDMPTILERFRIEYAYSPELPGFIADVAIDPAVFASNGTLPATRGRYVFNKVALKAVLSRTPGQTADRTPVLKEYKLLIEA